MHTIPAVLKAQRIVTQLFAGIDVTVVINDYHGSCGATQDRDIQVHVIKNSTRWGHVGKLAYAENMHGGSIWVFYDRLQETTNPGELPNSLAQVLVNEIIQVLQGIDPVVDLSAFQHHLGPSIGQPTVEGRASLGLAEVALIHRALDTRSQRDGSR
jgi:hypothetical protein